MRDDYKILGLEEGASLKEVKARYLDLKKELISAAEKGLKTDITVEEINESYRNIKKSGAIVDDTDLEEHLKKHYQRRMAQRRKAKVKKIILASSVLSVCLIIGIVLFSLERAETPIRPWPTTEEEPNAKSRGSLEEEPRPSVLEAKRPEIIAKVVPKEPNKPAARERDKPADQDIKRIETAKLSTKQPSGIYGSEPEKMQGKEELLIPPTRVPAPPPEAAKAAAKEPVKSILPEETKSIPEKIEGIGGAKPIPKESSVSSIPGAAEVKIKEEVPTPPASKTPPPVEVATVVPQEQVPQEQRKTGGAESAKISEQKRENEKIASLSIPSLTIARDREVRQFFDDYITRYNRLEIDAFMEFFSMGAIQNQKDDVRKIRSIYETFFKQMESVRYEISINNIEPKQDRVEVKADYILDGLVAKGRRAQNWKGQIRWVLIRENGALKIISLDYQPQRSK